MCGVALSISQGENNAVSTNGRTAGGGGARGRDDTRFGRADDRRGAGLESAFALCSADVPRADRLRSRRRAHGGEIRAAGLDGSAPPPVARAAAVFSLVGGVSRSRGAVRHAARPSAFRPADRRRVCPSVLHIHPCAVRPAGGFFLYRDAEISAAADAVRGGRDVRHADADRVSGERHADVSRAAFAGPPLFRLDAVLYGRHLAASAREMAALPALCERAGVAALSARRAADKPYVPLAQRILAAPRPSGLRLCDVAHAVDAVQSVPDASGARALYRPAFLRPVPRSSHGAAPVERLDDPSRPCHLPAPAAPTSRAWRA